MGIHTLFPLEGEEGARVVESYSESYSSIRGPPRRNLSDEQMEYEQMECPTAVQTSPSKRLYRDLVLCIADFLSDDSRNALALCNKSLFEHLGIKHLHRFGYFDRPRYKVERTTLRQRFLMLLERDVAELIVCWRCNILHTVERPAGAYRKCLWHETRLKARQFHDKPHKTYPVFAVANVTAHMRMAVKLHRLGRDPAGELDALTGSVTYLRETGTEQWVSRARFIGDALVVRLQCWYLFNDTACRPSCPGYAVKHAVMCPCRSYLPGHPPPRFWATDAVGIFCVATSEDRAFYYRCGRCAGQTNVSYRDPARLEEVQVESLELLDGGPRALRISTYWMETGDLELPARQSFSQYQEYTRPKHSVQGKPCRLYHLRCREIPAAKSARRNFEGAASFDAKNGRHPLDDELLRCDALRDQVIVCRDSRDAVTSEVLGDRYEYDSDNFDSPASSDSE